MDETAPAPQSNSASTEFASRRFLVSGGAQGLGLAIVNRLAAAGASGLILDLGASASVPAPWPSVAVDVTDEAAVRHAIESDVAEHGAFNGLVAAAGIVPAWHNPTDIDLDVLDKTIAVNVAGFVSVMKYAARDMPRNSTIVAIGSLNSWRGDPNVMAYAASKHAVLGVVRSAAQSLGPRGIRVNAVAPGPVATAALLGRMKERSASTGMEAAEAVRAAEQLTVLGALASAHDVANAVAFLSSPSSAAITGHLLPVDGGLL